MKNVKIANSLVVASMVLILSGCGSEDEEQKSLYPAKPTISVSSLEVNNGGSEVIFHINVHNEHPSTYIEVSPWNDTTYYFAFNKRYSDGVRLACNSLLNGNMINCNKVDEVVCNRVLIGGTYSEYRCDLKIAGVIYPQFQDPMRVAITSNTPKREDVLVTVGTEYWYEANGNEDSRFVYANDTSKMFNVFTDGRGI